MPDRTPGATDPRWRACHPTIRSVPLDDELAVFNPVSWETHLLNPGGAQVFEVLLERAASIRELRAELEALRADEGEPIRDEQIEALLAELEDLGLITRVSGDADR